MRTPGRGTLARDKPPILGLIQRGGQVVLRMLANVRQATVRPLIEAAVVKGCCRERGGNCLGDVSPAG